MILLMKRWLVLWRLLIAAAEIESQLLDDDECRHAKDCTLQALQRRSRAKQGPLEDADNLAATADVDLGVDVDADDLQAQFGCYGGSASKYYLNWEASGKSFFKDWTFVTEDPTNGEVNYVPREAAISEGLVETFQDHAVIRVGALENGKRNTVRVQTNKAWDPTKSFLVTMKYRHVPYGAGVWPAFWTMSSDHVWPEGGELDIAEFANDQPNLITLHVRGECSMNKEKLRLCTPASYTWYDTISTSCDTDYGQQRQGCKPPQKRYLGEIFNMYPGTFAAEWNNNTIKVWHFPEGSEPADLNGDPNPESWDPEKLLTWFPFEPDTCQNAFSPQELVINTELCGDYAGNMFELTPLSFATGYRSVFGNCAGGKDCCKKWIEDSRATRSLKDYAYWDIDYIKVFTLHGEKDYAQASGTFLRNGKALHLQEWSASNRSDPSTLES